MGDLHVMRDDLRPPNPPPTRHLISIGDLSREDVERLLATARTFEFEVEIRDSTNTMVDSEFMFIALERSGS